MLVPDEVWNGFRDAVMAADGRVMHEHVFFAACRRGLFPRPAAPIHRYFLESHPGRIRLNKNHLRDLQAAWDSHGQDIRHPHEFRTFWGRLTELQVFAWFEAMGWTVVNLEAWGGKYGY